MRHRRQPQGGSQDTARQERPGTGNDRAWSEKSRKMRKTPAPVRPHNSEVESLLITICLKRIAKPALVRCRSLKAPHRS